MSFVAFGSSVARRARVLLATIIGLIADEAASSSEDEPAPIIVRDLYYGCVRQRFVLALRTAARAVITCHLCSHGTPYTDAGVRWLQNFARLAACKDTSKPRNPHALVSRPADDHNLVRTAYEYQKSILRGCS